MLAPANKWSFFCFSIVLLGIANWRHFSDLILWTQEVSAAYFITPKRAFRETIQISQIEYNCGVRQTCPKNTFPIFLSTGASPDFLPRLCVSGKYVIRPTLKGEGRGLNAAIVDSNQFEVVSVRNFDTYLFNKSVEIAEWLNGVLDNDILIMFTSDEASAKLFPDTLHLLNKFGSGKIQNLQFRSQWYMISQKKIPGFTVFEKLTYSKKKNWGDTIEFRGCIPKVIPKRITSADEPLKENKKKVQFCEGKKDNKYKGFCNEPRFEIIMPAFVTNNSLIGNPVYTLPIYVFAGKNLELLIATLDSLIHQPGILVSFITVLYKDNDYDIPGLARTYGMQSNNTNFSQSFENKLHKAREMASKNYPKKKFLIVIDSNVIPSPDFLFYMAQTLPILQKDNSVFGISGWSVNCYDHNGSVHHVYRVKGSPKYAALISTESELQFYGDMYGPDVSRVQGREVCHLPSLEPNNWIERPQDLTKERYFQKMIMLQHLSHVIDVTEVLSSCSPSVVKNDTNVIYVKTKDKSMSKVLQCLGVINNQYGEYNGVVRLFVNGKTVLIITSESTFYKSRPIASM